MLQVGDSNGRGLVIRRQVVGRDGGVVAVPDLGVMRRHDFHPAFVEGILDILVQFAVDPGHDFRSIGIGVQLVSYVKIVEPGLQHEGRWTLENMCGSVRRLDEQRMDRSPRGRRSRW